MAWLDENALDYFWNEKVHKKKVSAYDTVAAMQEDEKLSVGVTAIAEGATYIVKQVYTVSDAELMTDPDTIYYYSGDYFYGGSDQEHDSPEGVEVVNGFAVLIPAKIPDNVFPYVTPQMFGAVGDGVTDDTEAIQDAIDTGMNVVGTGVYKTTNSLILTGNNRVIDFSDSTINYVGNDEAITIVALRDSTIKFGFLNALSGVCVHFTGAKRSDYSQYVNLYFHSMKANTNCIVADPDYTWCNEIRLLQGKFEHGTNAVFIDSKRTDANTMATGWRFFQVGFEGVTNGVYIQSNTDWSSGYSFIDCRYAETDTTLIVTVGKVERILFIGNQVLRYDWLNLSNTTVYSVFITPFLTSENNRYDAMLYDRGSVNYPLNSHYTTIEAATDINTIIADGEYYAPSSVINYPPRCSPYGRLTVTKSGTSIYQKWQGSTTSNARYSKAYRTSRNNGSSWTSWMYDVVQTSDDNITTDLNGIVKPGTYRISGSINRPASCNDGGTLVVSVANVNVLQEYTANVKNDSQYWRAFRSSNNSGTSWNDWKYITI